MKQSISLAAKNKGFLFPARKYFSPINLYTLCVSQVRGPLEYCLEIWKQVSPSTVNILNSIQRRVFRLINSVAHSENFQPSTYAWPLFLLWIMFERFCLYNPLSLVRQIRSCINCHPSTVHPQKTRTIPTSTTFGSFVFRISWLWNSLLTEAFPSTPYPQYFKSRINSLLPPPRCAEYLGFCFRDLYLDQNLLLITYLLFPSQVAQWD